MSAPNRGNAYLENRILAADPLELISIFYETAITTVKDARECSVKGNASGRLQKIAKAIAIVTELERSLDHSKGGDIAKNMSRLYQYVRTQLATASTTKQDGPLSEASKILKTMAEGWDGVRKQQAAAAEKAALEEQAAQRLQTPADQWAVPSAEIAHSWVA